MYTCRKTKFNEEANDELVKYIKGDTHRADVSRLLVRNMNRSDRMYEKVDVWKM